MHSVRRALLILGTLTAWGMSHGQFQYSPSPISEDYAPVPLPKREPPPVPRPTGPPATVYTAVRSKRPVTIDGILDEPIWDYAPKDDKFYSRMSQPYGQPSPEPTQVQVAYDDDNLYVAFRCRYSSPGARDNAIPENELRAAQYSEAVSVQIDSRYDRANAISFQVTRLGFMVDVEMANNGETLNWEWHGLWYAATKYFDDAWTAEIAIPWGTLNVPHPDRDFVMGINFRRKVPSKDSSAWALMPPAFQYFTPVSYFGLLKGLSNVHPGQHLFFLPYVAATYWRPDVPKPILRDFIGRGNDVTTYAGLSGWVRPSSGVRFDFTVNPDFSLVPPDSALAKLDRFEVLYPEVRPFFNNDSGLFRIGPDDFQLFYSRRIGVRSTYYPNTRGVREEVPILGALKGIVRSDSLEAGVLNVATSTFYDTGGIAKLSAADLAENITVARVNELLGQAAHVGGILMNRATLWDPSAHRVYGLDGQASFFDQHLFVGGFGARSDTSEAKSGWIGRGEVRFASQQFQISESFLTVTHEYDTSLGFIQETGIRENDLQAAYLPPIGADLINNIEIGTTLIRRDNYRGTHEIDRKTIYAKANLVNWAELDVSLDQSTDVVFEDPLNGPFTLAGFRYVVPAGTYNSVNTTVGIRTPPQQLFELEAKYREGDLFGGYQRLPSLSLGSNLGRFNGRILYELYYLTRSALAGGPGASSVPATSLLEHRLSAQFRLVPSQSLALALIIEANTLDPYSRAQLSAIWRFGTLSSLSFVVTQNAPSVWEAIRRPYLQGGVTFTYGFSVF